VRGLRYPVVVVIVIAVVGLLFGGQWLYYRFILEKPVVDALDLPEIEKAEYVEATNTVAVELKEVDNIQETFAEIKDRIKGNKNADSFLIKISDNRSKLLKDAYHQSQFAVHQAIMRGDFISMNEVIRDIASQYELDRYAVYIDSDNVYLQFHKDGSNLYEIISREVPGRTGLTPQNGSD